MSTVEDKLQRSLMKISKFPTQGFQALTYVTVRSLEIFSGLTTYLNLASQKLNQNLALV